ncbi:hypothetical protein JTE90_010990 [Oedothorax gibbosus]|uniref:Uncharacterized protein n=1 Tax=Oedothorax gibbosus TaxID=931172 RepID=A0AAV6VDW5_9ARAC|nr:hypothetical protein JTE90_010990 [Oedothorax gibbosus]
MKGDLDFIDAYFSAIAAPPVSVTRLSRVASRSSNTDQMHEETAASLICVYRALVNPNLNPSCTEIRWLYPPLVICRSSDAAIRFGDD